MAFTGYCAKGHDRIDFTDGAAWDEHHATEHGKKKLKGGGPVRTDSGLRSAPMRSAKPHAWKAPKPKPGGLDAWVKAGVLAVGDLAEDDRWVGHRYSGAMHA